MTPISYNCNTEYTTKWKHSLTWYDVAINIACRPGLWLTHTFSTSPLIPLNRIKQNLTGSNIPTSSTRFMFCRPIGKIRWPPWHLIGWEFFTRQVRDLDILQLYGKIRHPSSQASCWNVKYGTRQVRDVFILQYYGKIRHPSSQGCSYIAVLW